MDIEYQLIIIALIHWIGDFLLQSTDMALNKSKSNIWLFRHVLSYCLPFLVLGVFFYSPHLVLIFTYVTFLSHFITDYYTSRWTGRLRAAEKYYGFPAFFSVIGLDQWIHIAQLFLTFKFLNSL